jgi:hypothetical protein
VLADTTPQALLESSVGKVWSLTADQATALRLQAGYQVSTMVNQINGISLRLISGSRPHESAVVTDPTLEEAYLLATGQQSVQV